MKLLVSVRSAKEAQAALAGGADLIDVKEPLHGALGRSDDAIIQAIMNEIDGRVPISAACGELKDITSNDLPPFPLRYLKFGLSGCRQLPWQSRANSLRARTNSIIVPTSYADFERAEAPPVDEVVDFVVQENWPVLLIDTFRKDGANLFDGLNEARLSKIISRLHEHQKEIALAGSLRIEHLAALKRLRPNWVAIRGAACEGANRDEAINAEQVSHFKNLFR